MDIILTHIKIINGYGASRPFFIARFEGFGTGYNDTYFYGTYNEGEIGFKEPKNSIKVESEDYALFLGEITLRQNIK